MSFRNSLLAMFVLLFASPAYPYVEWEIQCNGAQTSFEGTVGVFNQYFPEGGDVTGYELLFEQFAIGTCETPEVFMTVPLHAPLSYAQYSISRPVHETNQYFRSLLS